MMMRPNLPTELAGHGLSDEELSELWTTLVMELMNPTYAGRTHQNRRTADAGCKGPLCRKAVREHGRRRMGTSPNERFKYVDEILTYWHPIAVKRIAEAQADVFKKQTSGIEINIDS
jgi:hypothetical protein